MSKRLFLSTIFLLGLTSAQNAAFAKIETVLGLPLNQNENLVFKLPETSSPEIILSRDQYVLSYNKTRRAPNYVAWKLEASQIGTTGRSNNFAVDDELDRYLTQTTSKHAVDPNEYKGSCFDRGHQIPSADRTDTVQNNESTFLMSNMIPQTAYLNRVIWEHLESYSRSLVQRQAKKLYIIAGPIYDKAMGAIGPDKDIQVPSKNFKLIYILNADQGLESINAQTPALAVIMPNILQNGSTDLSDKNELCKAISGSGGNRNDWEQYKTTLSEIEKLSGLTFSREVTAR